MDFLSDLNRNLCPGLRKDLCVPIYLVFFRLLSAGPIKGVTSCRSHFAFALAHKRYRHMNSLL